MKFTLAFEIKFQDETPLYMCKGDYWPIHHSNNPDQWLDDLYSSMDYIDLKQKNTGWLFLTNIKEPVFLLHHCVSFDQVKSQLPTFIEDINKYDYIQNSVYWCNKLHRWQKEHDKRKRVNLPCGPYYRCTKHKKMLCQTCVVNNNKYTNDTWELKYKCNMKMSSNMWILDSRNGLNMTMIQTIKKIPLV